MVALPLEVRITRVVDGDSLEVESVEEGARSKASQDRVRLWGIDAPEFRQPLGYECRGMLKALCGRAPTPRDRLLMEDVGSDQYGRRLGVVYWESRGRERSVNREMLLQGYAYYRNVDNEVGRANALGLPVAQEQASRKRAGVWGVRTLWGSAPEPPWAHRKPTNLRKEQSVPLRHVVKLEGQQVLFT